MKRFVYLVMALTLVISMLLVSCGGPATPSKPAVTTTAPATTTSIPQATATARPTATPTATGTAQYGGTLRIIEKFSPSGLYPPVRVVWGTEPSLETLLNVDSTGKNVPSLATDWKLSADASSLTLTLRKGVKFHDGTDFNAQGAKFNFDALLAAKAVAVENIKSVDVVNDNTIRLNLSFYSNSMMNYLAGSGTAMSSPTAAQTLSPETILYHPVGTGPFKFVDFDSTVALQYTRFDSYWQAGRPYLDGIRIIYIADPTTAEQALQRGEADASIEVDALNMSNLKKAGFTPYAEMTTPYLMCPDSDNPKSPFVKKEVRQALEYAIDGPSIAKAVGYGYWVGVNQIVTPNNPVYVKDLQGHPYNPAKAKELLAAAGYEKGFTTTLTFRNTSNLTALAAVQQNLKEVGITLNLNPVTTTQFTTITRGGWKDGLIQEFIAMTSNPSWLPVVNTTLAATSLTAKSTVRPDGWQDLLTKALSATDDQTQLKLSQDLVRMASDTDFVIPWTAYGRGEVILGKVHNFDWLLEGTYRPRTPADTWLSK